MPEYLKRPEAQPPEIAEGVRNTVSEILLAVEKDGLEAVRRYSEKLDNWNPESFMVSGQDVERAAAQVDETLRGHIEFAQAQVRGFAQLQRDSLVDFERETLPGVTLGQKQVPVANVGSYSPGGRYPMLASSIMTVAVPKVAGVPRVVAIAPPRQGGGIHPPQLFAMATSGADEIWCIGGVQGLAALAFGIEGLDPVDMLVGAGNQFVAEAKRQLFGVVGIDLLAGPTEIMILADDSTDPDLLAVDLLGQAEHGANSPAWLATTSRDIAQATIRSVEERLLTWPTAEVAGQAWRERGAVILCADDAEMARVADQYAPEHLEVQTEDPDWFLQRLVNYGSLFLGQEATVAYGDKGVGTNHVLPTERAARYTGGLWAGKFLKTVTYQRLTDEGTRQVAPSIAAICDAELMLGHGVTARHRLERLGARV